MQRLALLPGKGNILSRERISPFGVAARTPLSLPRLRGKRCSLSAILPSARRAESTCAPAGAKKEHPYGCSFSNR